MLSSTRHTLSFIRSIEVVSRKHRVRYISLTGAIERGLRETQRSLDGKRDARGRPRGLRPADRQAGRREETESQYKRRDTEKDVTSNEPVPRTLPYTTAASEFIYGTFAVNAAIRAGRRQLYKLYIHGSDENRDSIGARATQKRAIEAGVEVLKVSGTAWRQLFDRMADGRPHNGYILEASPIPTLPVAHLQQCDAVDKPVCARVGQVAPDDTALSGAFQISASTATIRSRGTQRRFPVLLLLDRVTDLGNLGAILRSAYFFGVNAVVLLDHGTAPLSGVTVKASAGAAEIVPIVRIKDETTFIKTSKENGWHFLAAIAPEDTPLINNRVLVPEHDPTEDILKEKPVVLMLGNEAEGLRPRIAKMANSTVSIQDAYGKHEAVDSLNVSVAAGILIHDLLRPFLGETSKS